MKRKAPLFLLIADCVLIALGWIMAFYAYPRLPQDVPLWINFFNQQTILAKKSVVFFTYPLFQTLFCIFFWSILRMVSSIEWHSIRNKHSIFEDKDLFKSLRNEYIYLVLIFFNLIFIHLQRSVILTAHDIEKGVDKIYFYSLFGIILILIPYYRLRIKLILKNDLR